MKHLVNNWHLSFSNYSTIIAEKGTLPNTWYKAIIIVIPTTNKDITEKENYMLLSLVDIDAEILNKITADQIQQYIKRIINHNQVRFIPGMQVWFNVCKSINEVYYMNKLNKKNHMIISIDTEKDFYKIQHPFMINYSQKRYRGNIPQYNKSHM